MKLEVYKIKVINDRSTFLETSCSTGFLYAIIYGRINMMLPSNVYSLPEWDNIIKLGYKGLLEIVDYNTGIISDACQGTGIENNVQEYEDRSTDYYFYILYICVYVVFV